MSLETEIKFTLNGRPVAVRVPVTMRTLTMLREVLGLTGTKYACGEGECRELVTIEGLKTPEGMNPVQQAFVDHGAVQCGFCMPGMIMQADYLVNENPNLTREDARRGLEGNLCRCTGYTKVLDAVGAVVEKKSCGSC